MTIDALRDRLAFWQRVLRLQDWDIHVGYPDQTLMQAVTSCPEAVGWSNYQYEYRKAVIWLRDPAQTVTPDDPTDGPFMVAFPYNVEQTLLHEVMHLVVRQGMDRSDVETSVELLANAFIRLSGVHEMQEGAAA